VGEPYCKLSNDCSYSRVLAGNKGGGCSCDAAGERPLSLGLGTLALAGLMVIAARRRQAVVGARRRRRS
jgi:MYXO-CTERM domain-containing protein